MLNGECHHEKRRPQFRLGLLLLTVLAPLTTIHCNGHVADSGTDTNTKWYRECDEQADCSEDTACFCGICTLPCIVDETCEELPDGARCVTTPGCEVPALSCRPSSELAREESAPTSPAGQGGERSSSEGAMTADIAKAQAYLNHELVGCKLLFQRTNEGDAIQEYGCWIDFDGTGPVASYHLAAECVTIDGENRCHCLKYPRGFLDGLDAGLPEWEPGMSSPTGQTFEGFGEYDGLSRQEYFDTMLKDNRGFYIISSGFKGADATVYAAAACHMSYGGWGEDTVYITHVTGSQSDETGCSETLLTSIELNSSSIGPGQLIQSEALSCTKSDTGVQCSCNHGPFDVRLEHYNDDYCREHSRSCDDRVEPFP